MTAVPHVRADGDVLEQFRAAIAEAGITPPERIIADGALHRYATNGTRDDAGWYVLHVDGIAAGAYGCWRAGVSDTWCARPEQQLTPAEREAYRRRMREIAAVRETERKRQRAEARERAAQIWDLATPAPAEHPYLASHGVGVHGIRCADDGRLVIPMCDADGAIQSIQYIDAAGGKRFLAGPSVKSAYHTIGTPGDRIVIVEGYATAAAIHEATGDAVAVAFSANNLAPVARALRAKLPSGEIIVAGDHDASGTGQRAAEAAARAVGGRVAIPATPGDWCDVCQRKGDEAVRAGIVAAHSPAAPQVEDILHRRASDITMESVRWLWPMRIARGKVSIIAGHPGLGKSQLTASLAAIVTTGGRWPVDRSEAPSGRVVILSAEDDPADTIVPRLTAAGADTSRVHIIDAVADERDDGRKIRRTVDILRDLDRIDALLARLGDVALLIVDPITAYLGGIDSHRTSDVRGALAPLADMAMRHGTAVVAVSHLRKAAGAEALLRITGSLAFVAAARATYVVARDPQDEHRRLFLPAKNNLGDDRSGLAYRIGPATVGDGIETSRIVWDSEPVTVTADEALAAPVEDEARTEREEAADWLRELLSGGPVRVSEIKREAKEAGLSWRTVERAKRAIGAHVVREGFGGQCRWSVTEPPYSPPDPHTRHSRQAQIPGEYGENEATGRQAEVAHGDAEGAL